VKAKRETVHGREKKEIVPASLKKRLEGGSLNGLCRKGGGREAFFGPRNWEKGACEQEVAEKKKAHRHFGDGREEEKARMSDKSLSRKEGGDEIV